MRKLRLEPEHQFQKREDETAQPLSVRLNQVDLRGVFDPRVPNAHPSQVFDPRVCEASWWEPSSLSSASGSVVRSGSPVTRAQPIVNRPWRRGLRPLFSELVVVTMLHVLLLLSVPRPS